jgi:hypothetical protein
MRLSILLLILICPIFSNAGGGRDGNGVAIVCQQGPPNWKYSNKTFLADTFSFIVDEYMAANGTVFKGGAPIRSDLQTEEFFLEHYQRSIRMRSSTAADIIRDRLKSIKFIAVKEVPNLDADKFDLKPFAEKAQDPLIAELCKPRQLARFDRDNNIVRYDEDLFKSLSNSEKALFRIHEAYVGPADPNQDNSAIHETLKRIVETGWETGKVSKGVTTAPSNDFWKRNKSKNKLLEGRK